MASGFNLQFPRIPDPNASESQASAAPYDVFRDAPKDAAAARSEVAAKAGAYGQLLTQTSNEMQGVNANKEAIVQDTAGKVGAIADTVQSSTQNLQQRSAPIFAKRAALDARTSELDSMNPIKKAILGIVNPMYNQDHIDTLRAHSDQELQDIGSEYSTTTGMNEELIRLAMMHGQQSSAVLDAHAETLDKGLFLASQGLAAARQQFGDVIQGVSATREVDAAQQQLAETALSSLTSQNINAALGEARKTGFATVNGAKISVGQLESRSKQLQGQDLELQTRQLALQSGKINLANAAEERMVNHMSPADLTKAAQNGGVFNGVQLSQPAIAQALAANASRLGTLQTLGNVESTAGMAMGAMDNWVSTMKATNDRVRQMFPGGAPPEFQAYLSNQTATINARAAKIASMKDPQAKQTALSQFYQEITGGGDPKKSWLGQLDGTIGSMIAKSTRSPAARATMGAFLTGNHQSVGDATQGIIEMMDAGGLPPGVKLSGPDGAAFQAAAQAYAGAKQQAMAAKIPEKEQADFIRTHVASALSSTYANVHGNALMDAIPDFASSIGHPFAAVTRQQFAAARAAGDLNGMASMASKLGLNVDQAKILFGQPASRQAQTILSGSTFRDKDGNVKPGMDMASLNGRLVQEQLGQMLHALDNGPAARPGFRPSQAYADLMQSGSFQAAANKHLDNTASHSFGSWLTDQVGGGGLRSNLYNYGQNIVGQSVQLQAQQNAKTVAQLQLYNGDPIKRASAVLGSIKGIDQHSEQVLLSYLHQIGSNPPQGMNSWDAITNAVHGGGGKFQDPRLEKVRKLAAAHWDDATEATDRAMDRMLNPPVPNAGFSSNDFIPTMPRN